MSHVCVYTCYTCVYTCYTCGYTCYTFVLGTQPTISHVPLRGYVPRYEMLGTRYLIGPWHPISDKSVWLSTCSLHIIVSYMLLVNLLASHQCVIDMLASHHCVVHVTCEFVNKEKGRLGKANDKTNDCTDIQVKIKMCCITHVCDMIHSCA